MPPPPPLSTLFPYTTLFRSPIGIRIARAFFPTRVSPDQVTLLSLIIGLAAGHCFVYTSPTINLLGFVLFIVSDLFDSAEDRKSTRLNSSHPSISYAVFCLKK